jgi:O-antigen/teichoic acid export membrane protein
MMLGAVAVAQALATLSMGSAATRTIAAHRLTDPARAWRMGQAAMLSTYATAGLGAIGMLVWLLASGRVEGIGIGASMAVAVIVLGLVLRGVLGGIITGFEAWRVVAISNIVAGVTMVIGGFLAPANVGPIWFLGVHAASQVISVIALGWSARSKLRGLNLEADQRRIDTATWRVLWSLSLSTFVLGAVPSVAYFIVQHWLERADATGMALAVFAITWQLGNMVLMMPSVVSRSFMPVVAGLRTPESTIAALRLVARLTAPGALIAAVVALPLLVAPHTVLSFYAPQYATDSASEALRWMAGWAMVSAATIGVEFVAVGRAAIQFALVTRLAWFGLLLTFLFSGWIDSVRGVAIAYMVASILQVALLVVSLLRGSLTRKTDI